MVDWLIDWYLAIVEVRITSYVSSVFVDIALYSQDKTEENERLSFISPCEIFDLKDILRNNKTKPAKRSQKETEDALWREIWIKVT
jgi:hypothetical protein